ncbi:MAG TPA: alpha/beta fold hydrolase [Polaromonas sp.]|uniref:alpha/beta hydrolase family protein n=1 Tax=Polaromonas sp. TaxID=1869339 RepID=UPI002D4469DA|nr:alpha/beta fold hydrolase [Polaromonas sp.]HYW56529.1 alpha/beta fold hydrolase [Polaromonas sp.]
MSLLRITAAVGVATVLLGLGACSTPPTHPGLVGAQAGGQLPPLLPVRRFVANIDAMGGYQLSPSGERLMWQQAVGLDIGIAVRNVSGNAAVTTYATGNMGRRGGNQYWLGDSRQVVYTKDPIGDENTRLLVQDTQAGTLAPWTVITTPGARTVFVGRGAEGSSKFFVASNQRDRSTLDLYEADAQTRSVREVARSDGTVLDWLIGTDRQLAGRVRQLGREDGADRVVELMQAGGQWRVLKTVGGFDNYWVNRLDLAGGKAWVISSVGRDKSALLEVDLATGQERVLASHDTVDLSSTILPVGRGAPLAYVVEPGHPEIKWLDSAWQRDVDSAVQKAVSGQLLPAQPLITRPQSISADNQRVVLRSVGEFDSAELLLDRRSGQVSRLNPLQAEAASVLSAQQPFSFKASDGRTIHGYVIRPRGVTGPAPLVVEIHGGPWARDSWSPAVFDTRQLLANRGYAVIMINYRGSTGYGREHIWAADGAYFGRLQQDIAEGVQWAVDQRIADPARIAVLGGSFGGFSVLAQLIQKPHNYRCGVDVVGVANWPRVVDNWPPFWRNRHWFARTFGDVNKPEERAQLLANSPVSHLDKITAPLLVIHGGNDIRVLKQDSDDVVAALQKLGRPVDYLLFADEGHSISKWRNRLAMWRTIEDKLATCLGGRGAGFDYYQLMPR